MEFLALERLAENCDWSGLVIEIGNFSDDSISDKLLPKVLLAVMDCPVNNDLLRVLCALVYPMKAKDLAFNSGVISVLIGLLDDKNLRFYSLKAMTSILYTGNNYEKANRNIVAIESVPKIVKILLEDPGDVEEKSAALKGLMSFAISNSKSSSMVSQRETLINAGVVPILSSILKSDLLSSLHLCAAELIAIVLYEIPQEARLQVEDEAVLRLMQITKSADTDKQCKGLNALYIINYICLRNILFDQELINVLVNQMDSTDQLVRFRATKVVNKILDSSESKNGKFYLAEMGVIPLLARNIEENNVKLRLESMRALVSVCANVDKFKEMVPSKLKSAVRELKLSGSTEEREAAQSLLNILTNSVPWTPTGRRQQVPVAHTNPPTTDCRTQVSENVAPVVDNKYRPPLKNAKTFDLEPDSLLQRRVVEVNGSITLQQNFLKNSRTNCDFRIFPAIR